MTISTSQTSSSYYISKCAVRGTAILQVLYGHFRFPSSKDIVFGKETSIELLVIDDDGNLQSICDQPVFGIIKDLAVLPCNDKFRRNDAQMCGKDLLVAISDSGKLSLLTFCNQMKRFFPITHVQLSSAGKMSDFRMLAVDSSGCFIAASAYEDQLALFSVSMTGSDIIDKKIILPSDSGRTESTSRDMSTTNICGTIWSMCFISLDSGQPNKEHNPLIAIILHRKGEILNELLLLEWNVKAQNITVISQYVEDGPLAHNIVEVPNSQGLAFLFRAGDVLLMNFRDPCSPCCAYRTSLNSFSVAMEEKTYVEDSCIRGTRKDIKVNEKAGDYDPVHKDNDNGDANSGREYVCSWSWEPDNTKVPRMIFCIDTGEFYLIEVFFYSDVVKVEQSECLYEGLPCKELLWVKGGYLASIVEMGDGLVLKLKDRRLCFTNHILNMAPILDVAHDEKNGQFFACCGVAPEGSLRIIQSGISVENEKPCIDSIYEEVIGIWALRMKATDSYHSFIVLSFVMETRIYSVGLSFKDVTASVGFEPNVCTFACGLVMGCLLVQIYQNAVKFCLPTIAAHSEGIPMSSPICAFWRPRNMNISFGAVGQNFIVVSTPNLCSLFIIGVVYQSAYDFEVFEMKHLKLQNQISCISIPRQKSGEKQSNEVSKSRTFVIGTHKPSVEIWSYASDGEFIVVARAIISLTSGICIPQDVRLVFADKYYVLAGLKNGMLLRFEWPSESFCSSPISAADSNDPPSVLQLVAIRHIGIAPVFLVPLDDTLDANVMVLSDKPWLLHTARQGLSYTSINVQSSSHVTPVCTIEYPKGILFVVENSLHLAEMFHNKRLNMQKFHLEGTPRKVLYDKESGTLLVMRTELNHSTYSSDICCVDPLSGSVLASFELEYGEVKSMELVKFGRKMVIVVGTSLSSGQDVKPNGETKSVKGYLLVLCLDNVRNSTDGSMTFRSKSGSSFQKASPFHELVVHYLENISTISLDSSSGDNSCDGIKLDNKKDMWQFQVVCATIWRGIPLAICPYLDKYFLASAGNAFYVCGLKYDTTLIGRVKVVKYAVVRTRFIIKSLTTHCSRIAVGDGRDGILFFSYDEDAKKLALFSGDASQRIVADCTLMDNNTAFVSDCTGSISVLCSDHLDESDNECSESNLRLSCAYFMGEVVMSILKCSYSCRLLADDALAGDIVPNINLDLPQNAVIASTLTGNLMIFFPLSSEEYKLLEAVQAKVAVHNLTAPILGNDHNEFRSRGNPVGVPKILDGDMLNQLLELTCMDQDSILQSHMVKEVLQIMEGVHYALN